MGVFKKGRDCWIDYYVNGRRKREKIGPNKRLAETVLQKRKVEIAEGKFLDKRKEVKVKFEVAANGYLNWSKANKRSHGRDRISLNNLLPVFGNKLLGRITTKEIEDYKARRREEVKPATVNRELACLKHLFTKAMEWEMAVHNPARPVKLFKEESERLRYLTGEEIDRLLSVAPNHLKPVLITALQTGMRRGEILNLKWEDVDFKTGQITVTTSKNGEKRYIPMSPVLRETLIKLPRHIRSPYVFCNKEGNPYWELKRSFKTALRKAGIENFRFHDLRHTFASHLVMNGVDLLTVKELLGHKTLDMTLRYSHLSADHKKKAILSLQRAMDTNMDTREVVGNEGKL
jgi:integrase